ncbi:Hypothetical protein I5071_31970 [Sandaracinus amylolyticus]|nr:Hypothetical protein I5071_31970 [Sandaracinus amylolyticus]
MIETFADLRFWFRERLESALDRHRIEAPDETRAYLVELLAGMGLGRRRAPGQRPLALQLKDAREAQGIERLRLYRALGDDALCLAGFFRDHLEQRGVSAGYVHTMGGGAYESAGVLAVQSAHEAVRIEVYRDLSRRFTTFAELLEEVRESTTLRTPQDIVKLYDRWRRTGSPRLAERLTREGVYPTRGSGGEGSGGSTLH